MTVTTHPLETTREAVEIRVEPTAARPRRGEPVTCGLPWPLGRLNDPSELCLLDESGTSMPLQARVLDRWPDGSVRWALFDWQATTSDAAECRFTLLEGEAAARRRPLAAAQSDGSVTVDTGRACFLLRPGPAFPFARLELTAGTSPRVAFAVEESSGQRYEPEVDEVRLEESGPLRARVRLTGRLCDERDVALLNLVAYLDFFADSATVRFSLTLHNPRKAEHPGGLWDLGNGGSVFLNDAALNVQLDDPAPPRIRYSAESDAPFATCTTSLELDQDSSGGANWKSENHLNHQRRIPHRFCGYRLVTDGASRDGRRATPIVALEKGPSLVGVAVPEFWQNFPQAIEATGSTVTLRLFPRQSADGHEIQGGEQKTHDFYVAFGPDRVTDEPLAWCRQPLLPRTTPAWYCGSGAVPYLLPRDEDPNTDYLALVDAAIEGDDTFEHKREVIDEYGWRHYGDIYGDHEAVFHQGEKPLASHYNNQYDPLAGMTYQFLRSGDMRWWHAARPLAAHVIDIDIYHTDHDKSAYNGGLFWHTYHYIDADTGTHRSYPRQAKLCGGGPSSEHNYTTGLMLWHFLTGDPRARATVVDLARWVIDMDDGSKTVFRWLDRGPTGRASATAHPLYHGPGRGAGNSVNALVDAHRLTGERRFLAKAEELIRRVIHPKDDVAARNLLDAERRWSYTVFLQALGKFLDHQAERGDLDDTYAYARAALLHYARWMAEHEYPFLDKPEILEYPTETWPAQEMRKSEVFKYAARHARGEERQRFLERAEFFFRSVTRSLAGMRTRTLCRPVVLLLSYGFMHAWFAREPESTAPAPAPGPHDFGRPRRFVTQKERAKRRFVAAAGGVALIAAGAGLVAALWL